jgi:hydrogenase nickel incorporation protein HypB
MNVVVNQPVLRSQQEQAAAQRQRWTEQGTLVVHLVSSPGAGKTSLLEATARHWKGRYQLGILVGDIATERDAERLAPLAPTKQLTTGGACHLEIPLVQRGWELLSLSQCDFLFIENVGNLVCPASFDLGEHLRVVLLSTTEGDDKPGKYPKMFRTSQALVITKTDLLPYVPFSAQAAERDAHLIQPQLEVMTVSALKGEGIAPWCQFLEKQRQHLLNGRVT